MPNSLFIERQSGVGVRFGVRVRLGSLVAAVSWVVAASLLLTVATPASATYGGSQTSRRTWAVALIKPGSGSATSRVYCTGVLINSTHVLTAKHCIEGPGITWTSASISLLIGRQSLSTSGGRDDVRSVSRVQKHGSQDLAMLTLDRSTSSTPLSLAGSSQVSGWSSGSGRDVQLYGFGLWQGSQQTGRVQEVTFRIQSHLDTYRLRAHWSGRSGCPGDSGGPVVSWQGGRPYLVAIWTDYATPIPGNCAVSSYQIARMVGYRGSSSSSPGYNWVRSND